jgi:flavin-dependent dehydrogenase
VTPLDVAIIGGGPAGLATSIEAVRRGLSVRVFERQTVTPDKACGEGIMPEGVGWLRARGVTELLDPAWHSPFAGIRYLQDGATLAEARFHSGPGLGIRRTALAEALKQAAVRRNIEITTGVTARVADSRGEVLRIEAGDESVDARFVVAADGLTSGVRRALGLDAPLPAVRRFGQRRHFQGVAASDFVEVHWSDGVEAYITPTGPHRCGVAFLWESQPDQAARFDDLLARFPTVRERFAGAETISEARGAGPLERYVPSCVNGRVIFAGDAAGYVDAITGEGLTLAFRTATALGEALADAVGGRLSALDDYARVHRRLFRRYALTAGSLVALSRRPWLRRGAFALLRRMPSVFDHALSIVG